VKYWVRDGVTGQPDLTLIVPLILGAFLLARFIEPLAWLSRWAFAFIVGFGSGQAMPTIINANVLRQLEYTLIPINDLSIQSISLAITVVGVLSVLVYFYFSMEHKGIVGGISKVGIQLRVHGHGSYGAVHQARALGGRRLYEAEYRRVEMGAGSCPCSASPPPRKNPLFSWNAVCDQYADG
jgi:hypothetical protein